MTTTRYVTIYSDQDAHGLWRGFKDSRGLCCALGHEEEIDAQVCSLLCETPYVSMDGCRILMERAGRKVGL